MNVQDAGEKISEKYFQITRTPHTAAAKEFLGTCRSYSVKVGDAVYKYYQAGHGPVLILVHGLHSNLSSMVALAEDLVEQHYRVVLFDAPAHGEARGSTTNPPQVRAVIRKICGQFDDIRAVICHSLGGMWALSAWHEGLQVKAFISIASPASKKFLVEKFAELNRIDHESVDALVTELEKQFGESVWVDYSPAEIAKTIGIPGLIIHGADDDFVPPAHARQIHANWPDARMELIDGAGHFDIIASPTVRQLVSGYLRDLC